MDPDERVPRLTEVKIRVKPSHFLALAKQELEKGNKSGAIQHYISYIENLDNPDEMKVIEQANLTKLIINLNTDIIDTLSPIENELLKCYLKVINKFPENAILLNAVGLFLFSRGEYIAARQFFQRSAALEYLPGEKNFLHVIWHLIPRWHFRMLNDRKRNESYQKAIKKAVGQGYKCVYDIGAGCGLLSLIAATASKDVKVVAFEESRILSSIASSIFKRNNVAETVKLIQQNSNNVEQPPESCNLIVTEIFDAGVFGEDCLKTIKDATERFVEEGKFKIIPSGVKLYVTGFQCEEISRSYRWVEPLEQLNLQQFCTVQIDPEPYDAEYLNKKDVEYLTGTKSFLDVNFYDKDQLNQLLTETECIDEIELVCTAEGVLQGLAVWFDLSLDEEVKISTNPENPDNECWEQAVYHVDHPVHVKPGDVVKLQATMEGGQICFEVVNPKNQCSGCYEVSPNLISFLNDVKLVQCVIKAAETFENPENLRIVDFNVFPLFGFLMAKRGATVYHIFKDECDLDLFDHVMTQNDLSSDKLIFIHSKSVENYMVYVEPPNVVYMDHIKTDGSWNKEDFTLETESKLSCEKLPKKYFLNAQLINSTYLDFCNKVDDRNAFNFEIFDEINKYSGSEHPNLKSFEHDKHSEVVTFDISDSETIDFHVEGKVTKDGTCNGILYWFDVQFTDDESNRFSTLDSTHYDKSCTLLKAPKCVKNGDTIMFHIMRLEGHLKVYCD